MLARWRWRVSAPKGPPAREHPKSQHVSFLEPPTRVLALILGLYIQRYTCSYFTHIYNTNVGMIFRIFCRHDFVLLYMNNSPQWAIEQERMALV